MRTVPPTNRRRFLLCSGVYVLAAALPLARAQQPGKKIPRIGFVLSSGSPASASPFIVEIKRKLGELGYVEGRDYLVEAQYSEGRLERMPGLVDRLVQQKVDLIVINSNVAIRAAMKATQTIPIVMVTSIDPVAAGYVGSLARPGANITGLAMLTRDLSAKRIELLKQMLPRMERLAVLWDTDGPGPLVAFKAYEAAGRKLRLHIQSLEVRGSDPDFVGAFRAAKEGRADAVIVVMNPLINHHQLQIIELAQRARLPAMYEDSQNVGMGGLLSFGANVQEMYRGVASYVDRILKGARPSDLPIEQPTSFELVVNLKTARALGLTLPQALLRRADRVIE